MALAAATDLWRVTLAMAQNERTSHKTHKVDWIASHSGTNVYEDLEKLAGFMMQDFKTLYFTDTHFLRMTAVQLRQDMRIVKGTASVFILEDVGAKTYATGDGPADENVAVRLYRNAEQSRIGIMELRWMISSEEFEAYINAKTVPARITTLPGGSKNAGETLAAGITKNFEAASFKLHMPPLVDGATFTKREVKVCKFHDIAVVTTTSHHTSGEADMKNGARKQIMKLWLPAKALQDDPATSSAETAALNEAKSDIKKIYDPLPAAVKMKLNLPAALMSFISAT